MATEVYGRVEFRDFNHEGDPDDQNQHGPKPLVKFTTRAIMATLREFTLHPADH